MSFTSTLAADLFERKQSKVGDKRFHANETPSNIGVSNGPGLARARWAKGVGRAAPAPRAKYRLARAGAGFPLGDLGPAGDLGRP